MYTYDREFCMHIGKFPGRSWAIILQQAWSMFLKDKLPAGSKASLSTGNGYGNHNDHGKSRKEACRKFNKGLCNLGRSCRYEHCCTVPDCGKFGHGAHICRKRQDNSGANQGKSHASASNVANK